MRLGKYFKHRYVFVFVFIDLSASKFLLIHVSSDLIQVSCHRSSWYLCFNFDEKLLRFKCIHSASQLQGFGHSVRYFVFSFIFHEMDPNMVLVYLKSMLWLASADSHILFYPQKCWSWLPLVGDNLRILKFLIICLHTYIQKICEWFIWYREGLFCCSNDIWKKYCSKNCCNMRKHVVTLNTALKKISQPCTLR